MPQELTPDAVLGQNEQFLIYGEPKTGKTELALTMPEPIYVLAVGPENELKTRYSKHFLTRQDGKHAQKKIYFDSVRERFGEQGEITDNPIGFDEACIAIDNMLEAVRKGDMEKPASLIIDNATVLEDYMMFKAMIAGYMLAGDKDKTALRRMRDFGIVKPGDSDWGAAQSLMTKFLNFVTQLPFHLVLVAHEFNEYAQKREGSREKVLTGVYPLFVGKQRTDIARLFDNVWRCSISGSGRSTQFIVQTMGSDTVVAGTRVGGVLNEQEKSLDLSEVIDKFKAYPHTLDSKLNVRAAVRQVKS